MLKSTILAALLLASIGAAWAADAPQLVAQLGGPTTDRLIDILTQASSQMAAEKHAAELRWRARAVLLGAHNQALEREVSELKGKFAATKSSPRSCREGRRTGRSRL